MSATGERQAVFSPALSRARMGRGKATAVVDARLTGAMLVATSWVATSAPLNAGPDIELGRYLASECMTCHRTATATSTIPNIFGLPEPHLTVVIKAYRDKKLPNPVMQNIAGRLSDDEIAALALYFSTTKRP
jgi:cytochrome c